MKIAFLLFLISIFGYSQNFEIYKKPFKGIISDKEFTSTKYSKSYKDSYKAFKKKMKQKGYSVGIASVNNHYIVKKDGIQYLSDTLTNIVNLPYNLDKTNRGNWQLLYPTKKGTVFIIKNWINVNELSESKKIEIYDLNGALIKKIENSEQSLAIGLGRYFKQIFTNYGDFLTFSKNKKIGLWDEFGEVFIEPHYFKIRNKGKYLFLEKGNEVEVLNLANKKKLSVKFEKVKLTDFENNFTSNKVIAKYNSKYGLYDLDAEKWLISADYDDLDFITTSKTFDQYTKNVRHEDIILTQNLLATKDNFVGLIGINNQITLPLQYSSVYCQNNEKCEVVDVNRLKNQFVLEAKQMRFDTFYKDIFEHRTKTYDLIGFKFDEYWEITSLKTKEKLITVDDKVIELPSRASRLPFLPVKFKDSKTITKSDGTRVFNKGIEGAYSITLKKFITKNGSIRHLEGTKDYYILRDKDSRKSSVIKKDGTIHFEMPKGKGKFAFNDGKFMYYKSGDYKKIYSCYDNDGNVINKSECSPLYGN